MACGGCAEQIGPGGHLEGGRKIRDLAGGGVPTAILYYRPDDCFACITPIAEWREIAAAGVMKVHLVMQSNPSPEQTRALRLQRITSYSVYARPWYRRAAAAPREFVMDTLGRLVAPPADPTRGGVTRAMQLAVAAMRAMGRSDFASFLK
ncbi:MAG: hypothetical protein AMXMBFR55_13310 [Gemmatimonadota bacterium]